MVKEILKLDVDINAIDSEGNSALHYALETLNYDIISELLKSGIDVNILNKKNENLFTFIIETNNPRLLNLSLKYHGDMNKIINQEEQLNIFLSAIKKEKWDLVKIMLRNKNEFNLDINSADIS
jgi:ankyrin repeat protein